MRLCTVACVWLMGSFWHIRIIVAYFGVFFKVRLYLSTKNGYFSTYLQMSTAIVEKSLLYRG